MTMYQLTPLELGAKIKEKEIGVEEVTAYYLDRIAAIDGNVSAFLRTEKEYAMKEAAAVQAKINDGSLNGPLAGVPYGIKDNICTVGLETTCASKILSGFVPPYDATLVTKLKDAGNIIVGKTNMDEFAMGSTTETSFGGVTGNPWNNDHDPRRFQRWQRCRSRCS